jgi:hypothetical protein
MESKFKIAEEQKVGVNTARLAGMVTIAALAKT